MITPSPPSTIARQSNSVTNRTLQPGFHGSTSPSNHRLQTEYKRFQLYNYSRNNPDATQQDIVTWYSESFGKNINQSTVSRALKRCRDKETPDNEPAGTANSNKRRCTGTGAASGTTAVAGTGCINHEEESARVNEQILRENRNAKGQKPEIGGKVEGELVLPPFQHSRAARIVPHQQPQQQPQHRRYGVHHGIPQTQPLDQGAPQALMEGHLPAQVLPRNPYLEDSGDRTKQPEIILDSDSEGENGSLNAYCSDGNDPNPSPSVGAPGATLPGDLSSPTATGESAETDTPIRQGGVEGRNGTGSSQLTLLIANDVSTKELIRKLAMEVVSTKESIRKLTMEVGRLSKEMTRSDNELLAKWKREEYSEGADSLATKGL